MRVTIPFYVDDEKDVKLLAWLNSQTNRSAFIRLKLYDCMKGNYVEEVVVKKKEMPDVNDNIMNSLINF
jgi:hypothetical protein